MALLLTWRGSTTLPVVADLRPEALVGVAPADWARWPARVGRDPAALGDLFRLDGNLDDRHLLLEGDLLNLEGVGAGMSAGRITVRGEAGTLLGAGMAGGAIEVFGAVGDRAGAEMKDGAIRIRGRAGDHLGAALPGSRLGMRGGSILVDGPIGDGAGLAMRRGLIAVAGPAGDDLGRGLIAGTIVALDSVGRRPGAGMKRGTILLGKPPDGLPPGFRRAGLQAAPFAAIYGRWLRDRGFPPSSEPFAGPFQRYNGDVIDGGQGEILVPASGRGWAAI